MAVFTEAKAVRNLATVSDCAVIFPSFFRRLVVFHVFSLQKSYFSVIHAHMSEGYFHYNAPHGKKQAFFPSMRRLYGISV